MWPVSQMLQGMMIILEQAVVSWFLNGSTFILRIGEGNTHNIETNEDCLVLLWCERTFSKSICKFLKNTKNETWACLSTTWISCECDYIIHRGETVTILFLFSVSINPL